MIPLVLTETIRAKLKDKHGVDEMEVRECFLNHDGQYLIDDREEHETDPPTLWFVGETHRGRILRIYFVAKDKNLYLKTALDASENHQRIYSEATQQEKS